MSGLFPIPPPFPTPVPNPDLLDTSPLWEYDNLAGTVSAFRTILIMADQNHVVTAFAVIGIIVIVIIWMSRLVSNRDSNV